MALNVAARIAVVRPSGGICIALPILEPWDVAGDAGVNRPEAPYLWVSTRRIAMIAITSASAASGRPTRWPPPTEATKMGQATAPPLHETFTRLTADASRPGLAAAMRTLVVGSTRPSPRP